MRKNSPSLPASRLWLICCCHFESEAGNLIWTMCKKNTFYCVSPRHSSGDPERGAGQGSLAALSLGSPLMSTDVGAVPKFYIIGGVLPPEVCRTWLVSTEPKIQPLQEIAVTFKALECEHIQNCGACSRWCRLSQTFFPGLVMREETGSRKCSFAPLPKDPREQGICASGHS